MSHKIVYIDEKAVFFEIAECELQLPEQTPPRHLVIDIKCIGRRGRLPEQLSKLLCLGTLRAYDSKGRMSLERLLSNKVPSSKVAMIPLGHWVYRKKYPQDDVTIGGFLYIFSDGKIFHSKTNYFKKGTGAAAARPRRPAAQDLPAAWQRGEQDGGATLAALRTQSRSRVDELASASSPAAKSVTPPVMEDARSGMKVNTEFLRTFAQSHKPWPFGAIAELVDNAKDARARQLSIDVIEDPSDSSRRLKMLMLHDDGKGMTPEEMKFMFQLSGSKKDAENPAMIGRYGVGFKSGAMTIATDCFVWSKSDRCEVRRHELMPPTPACHAVQQTVALSFVTLTLSLCCRAWGSSATLTIRGVANSKSHTSRGTAKQKSCSTQTRSWDESSHARPSSASGLQASSMALNVGPSSASSDCQSVTTTATPQTLHSMLMVTSGSARLRPAKVL
eukprot:SAG11_NODE_739_length_7425_cov_67.127082_5_plen_446_part_00